MLVTSRAAASDHPGRRAVVVTQGLTKRFPRPRPWRQWISGAPAPPATTAIEQLDLTVFEGEFFGLLGANGAGKTTFLKMLSTLITPDSGTASVAGHDLSVDPRGVRRVLASVVPDARSLNWRVSASENLRLYASLYGVAPARIASRIGSALETVGLDGTGDTAVGTYSSGMKQRLLIARALLADPRVLLLDEPTRSLDPLAARRFRSFLKGTVSAGGRRTVLLATHATEEALQLCDRIAVLDRGRAAAVGTPSELMQRVDRGHVLVWTTTPHHRAFAGLVDRHLASCLEFGIETSGQTVVDIEVSGGTDRAGTVLKALVEQGADVSRFERKPVTLADLIEHVLADNVEASFGA